MLWITAALLRSRLSGLRSSPVAPGFATLHAFDALLPVQNSQELRLVNHNPTVAELNEDHAISLVLPI